MVETQRIVEWLHRLVHIPSVGPRNAGPRSGAIGEGRIAAQAAAWFEALGGEVERADVYPGRPNTYGVWRGQTDRWIAVDVHIDTVGVETMIGDPFDGRLENGRAGWTSTDASGAWRRAADTVVEKDGFVSDGREFVHGRVPAARCDRRCSGEPKPGTVETEEPRA